MTLSERFAQRILSIAPERLLPEDLQQTQRLMLDLLGTAYAGAAKPWARAMRDWAKRYDGVGKAGLIAGAERLPAMIAALVNGTAGHSYELDDTHDLSLSHPGAVIIPTALAVASETGASGARVVAAIIAGYEAVARIGTAANGGLVIEHGHHPTAVFGVFGATAVAACLHGLNVRQLCMAWGHALSLSAGSMQFSDETQGTAVKRVHAGYAAKNGVLAAELAMQGVEAPHRALEGKYGFLKLYGHAPRPDVLDDNSGPYAIHSISLKPYACCRFFHSAIDAILALMQDGIDRSAVESITVRGARVIGDQHMMRRPESPMAAQYSLPYVVGATLEFGPAGFEAYETKNLAHAGIRHWAELVQFEQDHELEAMHPAHLATDVEIVHGGARKRVRVIDSVGTAARPLSWAQVAQKVAGLTQALNPPLDVERLECAIEGLPASASVVELERAIMAPTDASGGNPGR